jgi:colicin import membrane protein
MKFLAVSVLGWVLVPLLALAQDKVELNTITAVKVNGNAVEITGTKKPNFSTFTMTDPPRLVIDVSEAILKGVPEETRVNNGLITGLRSANYGSETSSIARVLIGYDRDVETDIQVTGNTLVVMVLDGAGPLVARATPPPEQPTQAPSQGTLVAEAGPGTQQTTQQANPTTQQANPAQQDKAALEKAQAEAAAAKKAEEDRRKQEEAARAEVAKKAEEDRRKQEEVARAEAAKKAEEDRRAQELAAAEEKKRKIEEARAEAEARKQEEAEEKKRKAEEAEQKRLAAAEDKKRRAEEAEQKRLAALEEKKRKEEAARAVRVASAEPPRARPEPEIPSAATVSGKHKILEIVGFQQQEEASRVYVRTSEPVSYKVSEGRNEIVLMLENTQIGKGNNTRALDTSFFDTAVARVDPTVGPDRTVRVSIKLKEQVSVQTRQEGNTISLEFPRPNR